MSGAGNETCGIGCQVGWSATPVLGGLENPGLSTSEKLVDERLQLPIVDKVRVGTVLSHVMGKPGLGALGKLPHEFPAIDVGLRRIPRAPPPRCRRFVSATANGWVGLPWATKTSTITMRCAPTACWRSGRARPT